MHLFSRTFKFSSTYHPRLSSRLSWTFLISSSGECTLARSKIVAVAYRCTLSWSTLQCDIGAHVSAFPRYIAHTVHKLLLHPTNSTKDPKTVDTTPTSFPPSYTNPCNNPPYPTPPNPPAQIPPSNNPSILIKSSRVKLHHHLTPHTNLLRPKPHLLLPLPASSSSPSPPPPPPRAHR